MLCTGYTKVWELAPNELVRVADARGTTLRVTRGRLWITLEKDARDIVLEAGDSYTIDRAGLTLVEAQSASTVCVLAHHAEESRHPVTHGQPALSIGDWLERKFAPDDKGGYSPYY